MMKTLGLNMVKNAELTKISLRDLSLPKLRQSDKKEDMRERIAKSAFELFRENGYQKTTMRQIAAKTGILNGSLYNAFKDKDQIFEYLAVKAMDLKMEMIIPFVEDEKDYVFALALPAVIDYWIAYRDPRIAELLMEAYKSWNIVNSMIEIQKNWFVHISERYHVSVDRDRLEDSLYILSSATGMIIERRFRTGVDRFREDVSTYLLMVLTLLHVPAMGIPALVDRFVETVKKPEFNAPIEMW